LEALEMLSTMSETRLKRVLDVLPRDASDALRPLLIDVKRTFENASVEQDDAETAGHDFSRLVLDYRGRMSLGVSVQKLLTAQEQVENWFKELEDTQKSDCPRTTKVIHQRAIQSLAELTAYTVEHFHRAGTLLLQEGGPATTSSFLDTATGLAGLSRIICDELGFVSARFVSSLTALSSASGESVTELVTSVYLETSNSSTYVQDAFQLLLPVLQLAIVKSNPLCKDLLLDK
jgi:hypothetical protein